MKILYEVSNLGLGHVASRSRAGIFRVIENVINETLKNSNIDLRFVSYSNFYQSVLTQQYFKVERPDLLEKTINTWRLLGVSPQYYTDIIHGLSSNQSQNIFNKGKRKIQATVLQSLDLLTRKSKITESFDIYHSFFYGFPPRGDVNAKERVITIHDMIPMLMPDYFVNDVKKSFRKNISSVEVERDWAICVSEATKRDFCHLTQMPEERVFVTYLAASDNFFQQTDQDQIEQVYHRYNIPKGKYLLGLSTLEPRKNSAYLIQCFYKLILENNLNDVYLVLVGAKGWLYDEIFKTVQSYPQLQNRVICTGYVDDKDLSSIYSGATAFIYPSLYEGFGLPPLEAMQCGLPVITSNTSSLPEVVGDAGIIVDPKDEDSLCQAMLTLLSNGKLRTNLKQKGLERAKQFSWSKCADETIEIYKKIVN